MAKRRLPWGCLLPALLAMTVVVLAGISIVRSAMRSEQSAGSAQRKEAPEPKPPADVSALLDGLEPGSVVGTWPISRIRILPDRRLAIAFDKHKVGFRIWVQQRTQAKSPPVKTEHYALTFGGDYGGRVPPQAEQTALQAVAARIRKTEGRVAVPRGL